MKKKKKKNRKTRLYSQISLLATVGSPRINKNTVGYNLFRIQTFGNNIYVLQNDKTSKSDKHQKQILENRNKLIPKENPEHRLLKLRPYYLSSQDVC